MKDRGPAGDRDASGRGFHPDERDRRRMGGPPYDHDRHQERDFLPVDRVRPDGDGHMEDDLERAPRPPPREVRGTYSPGLDEDQGRRDIAGRPSGDPDRSLFPNEPARLDEPERRPDRPEDEGGRRDKLDRRSDSHRRRKKDKKRRERSRSRGRNDEPRRKDRNREDRRRNADGNPDYYGPTNGEEGGRRRGDERDRGDRRDRHRDRNRH